jgi:phosphoadenosine phosphosulfate reductase
VIDTVLQFSGGKDSLACLMLLRERWAEMYVLWVNTGAAYPSTVEYMESWRNRLPHFVEVKSDQPAQMARYGYPSDVVPIRFTEVGRLMGMNPSYLIQDYLACCNANIWQPMAQKTRELGAKFIIRGQRSAEGRKAPFTNGYVEDGVTYLLPIEDWTTDEVFRYLNEIGEPIPPYYLEGERSGRDCWDCTAYLDDNVERIKALPRDKREIVEERLVKIEQAALGELWSSYG